MHPADHVTRHARERADALAVVGTGVEITYAQLAAHAAGIAALLRQRGVSAGHVIAVTLPAQLEVILIQSAFRLAAISCHLPVGYAAGGELEVDWLVATTPNASVPPERTIIVDGSWLRAANNAKPDVVAAYPSDDAVARLVFSSGTTGSPKAVPMSIANLEYRASIAPTHWMSRPPILCLLDLTTASGTTAFFTALTRGETYLLPGTPVESLALMERHSVASIKGSPAQLDALATAFESGASALPSLRLIQSVGSYLPEALALRLGAVFGVAVANLYGSSESGVLSIRASGSTDPMDAGTIVHDMAVEIVDESHSPLSPGKIGAIRSMRPTQAAGYFRDAASSAAHFRDGWFYPGDLGSLAPDGSLTLAGRESELVNAGGVKVDPARIDAAASGFDGLQDAAAFALTTDAGVARIGLAIVGEVDVTALVAHLRMVLGSAAPHGVVRVETIPRTATGKARRGELTTMLSHLLP